MLTRSGPPFEILHLWHARRFTLIVTDRVNHEYHRVLSGVGSKQPQKLKGFDARLFLYLIEIDAVWIDREVDPMIRSRDPNDDHLLAAALSGNAECLVTGDLDLLELAGEPRLGNLRIITPREFLLERNPKR